MGKRESTGMDRKKMISSMVRIVLKSNRLQAGALGITYLLTFALLVMLSFFYPSIEKTFDRYLDEYGLPEATILTAPVPRELAREALRGEESAQAALRTVLEAQTVFSGSKTVACRFLSVSPDDMMRFHNIETREDVQPGENTLMISSWFATHNGVHVGDFISIHTPSGIRKAKVTDIVSSPETISTNRNAFSWCDNNDYACIFVGNALMDELFACGNICNRIDLRDRSGADVAPLLERVKDRFGTAVTYAGTFEGSETQRQIKSSLDSTRAVVDYIPVLLVGMGILFSTLFFIQIVNRGEEQNGLLLALGYEPRQISRIYVRCALILSLGSAVFGFALGFFLLQTMLKLYIGLYDLPFLAYDGSVWLFPLLVAVIVLVGILSSLLACFHLGKMDPMQVLHPGGTEQKKDLPGWMQKLKIGAFFKMSLSNIFRNHRRFLLSLVSGIACLVLTFMSLSILTSKNEGIRWNFEERFQYDLAFRAEDEAALNALAALPGVSIAEKIREWTVEYEEETMLLEALPEDAKLTGILSVEGEKCRVPMDGHILLEEGFARRHHLSAGDLIRLGEVSLTVEGLIRTYYHSIQIVPSNTAAEMGYPENNTVLVTLDGSRKVQELIADAAEIQGFQYYTDMESRQSCAHEFLSAIDLPCYVFTLFSVVIGAIIISTMNLITFAQRRRKYATLYVLGTSAWEFLSVEFPEVLLQFILTVLLGAAPAVVCARAILLGMSAPSQEYVLINPPFLLCISAIVVALYLGIGIQVTMGAIRRMDYLKYLSER